MNINDVEDEIYGFCNLFFKDIDPIVEDGIALINDNGLVQPKENYRVLIEYLSTTLNHFKNLDYSVIDETLKKLHRDVLYLDKVYTIKKEQASNIEHIFKHKFLNKSPLFISLSANILKLKNTNNLSDEEKLSYKKLMREFQELEKIYYEVFQKIFVEDRTYFLNALLVILNTKTFYLDKLLWKQVCTSETIMKTLKGVSKTNKCINSKLYLGHRLNIIIPYSKDYKYLQKCLKVYK